MRKGVNMKDVLIKARTLASGKTVYEYRFEIASVNGKRKWKSKSGFKTKTEAKQAGKLAQQTYENVGQAIEPSNISYSDFLDEWIEQANSHVNYLRYKVMKRKSDYISNLTLVHIGLKILPKTLSKILL